jgi:hypothetical protein
MTERPALSGKTGAAPSIDQTANPTSTDRRIAEAPVGSGTARPESNAAVNARGGTNAASPAAGGRQTWGTRSLDAEEPTGFVATLAQTIKDQPVPAVLLALVVGFVLGRLTSR